MSTMRQEGFPEDTWNARILGDRKIRDVEPIAVEIAAIITINLK